MGAVCADDDFSGNFFFSEDPVQRQPVSADLPDGRAAEEIGAGFTGFAAEPCVKEMTVEDKSVDAEGDLMHIRTENTLDGCPVEDASLRDLIHFDGIFKPGYQGSQLTAFRYEAAASDRRSDLLMPVYEKDADAGCGSIFSRRRTGGSCADNDDIVFLSDRTGRAVGKK